MATLDYTNPYQAWILSPEEQLQARVLTSLQKQFIQNERVALLSRKANLRLDPEHPLPFIQEEAELQGQIGILGYLLAESESAETALNGGRPAFVVVQNSQEN